MNLKTKKYLKNTFLLDVYLYSEKVFWKEIFSNKDDFLEMLSSIDPFKNNLELLSKVVSKYLRKSDKNKFNYIWKYREDWILKNTSKDELFDSLGLSDVYDYIDRGIVIEKN